MSPVQVTEPQCKISSPGLGNTTWKWTLFLLSESLVFLQHRDLSLFNNSSRSLCARARRRMSSNSLGVNSSLVLPFPTTLLSTPVSNLQHQQKVSWVFLTTHWYPSEKHSGQEPHWPSGLWRWPPGAGENGWCCSLAAAPKPAAAQRSRWEGYKSSFPCSEWNWRLQGSGPASGTGPGWAFLAPLRGDLDKETGTGTMTFL